MPVTDEEIYATSVGEEVEDRDAYYAALAKKEAEEAPPVQGPRKPTSVEKIKAAVNRKIDDNKKQRAAQKKLRDITREKEIDARAPSYVEQGLEEEDARILAAKAIKDEGKAIKKAARAEARAKREEAREARLANRASGRAMSEGSRQRKDPSELYAKLGVSSGSSSSSMSLLAGSGGGDGMRLLMGGGSSQAGVNRAIGSIIGSGRSGPSDSAMSMITGRGGSDKAMNVMRNVTKGSGGKSQGQKGKGGGKGGTEGISNTYGGIRLF